MSGIVLLLILAGFIEQGFLDTLRGLLALQAHPARLIHDFTALEGAGAALVNSGLVSALALTLVKLAKVRLAGPTIAVFLTIMGFSLFGKTLLNVGPIIFGGIPFCKSRPKTLCRLPLDRPIRYSLRAFGHVFSVSSRVDRFIFRTGGDSGGNSYRFLSTLHCDFDAAPPPGVKPVSSTPKLVGIQGEGLSPG
jgi:hypothetical protein